MKYIFLPALLVILLAAGPVSAASSSLASQFGSLVASTRIPADRQAACAADASGNILSSNADMRVIPASVSKLYAFDFALNKLPIDFRYTTTFYLRGTTLYINGGGDPHFVIEHLRSVVQKIYDEQHVRVATVVFSPNFYFNWKSSATDVRAALIASLKETPQLPIASRISVVPASGFYTGLGKRYEFRSAPLPALIKQISDYSTNIAADVLFSTAGGAYAYPAYLKKTYGADASIAVITRGSGLEGNYTTCALTLKVIKHLQETVKAKGLAITDIMTMPQVDPGVLEKRAISAADAQSVVAKSGYVNNHHSLAGIINTSKGPVYFGIFTYFDTDAKNVPTKNMVDAFLNKIIDAYRPKLRPFDYVPDLTQLKNVMIRSVS